MKTVKRTMGMGVCMVLAMGAVASAGWFSREPEAPKEERGPRVQHKYVLNVPDKKTEQELMSMLSGRKAMEEDVAVLRRLLQSRINLHGAIQKAFSEEFGIAKGMKWEYETETMTITGTPATPEAAGAASSNAPYQRKLTDKAQEEKLLRMKRDAAMVVQQIGVLQDLLKEQDSVLKRQTGLLASKFSLKPDKMYYYDRKAMTLYEVVNPPGSANKPAPRRR